MRNDSNILVFDFETGGLDVNTLEVLSIAGKAVNGITLQPYPKDEGEFYSLMKPLDFNNLSQKALDVNKITRAELKDAPDREVVIREFIKFVKKYNKGRFGQPIVGGKNIINFDLPILDRLLRQYKLSYPFNDRMILELEHFLYLYTNGNPELPNMKMDTIRPYFGLSTEGAHHALIDARQTAELIIRFVKLGRHFENKISFKDSCKDAIL